MLRTKRRLSYQGELETPENVPIAIIRLGRKSLRMRSAVDWQSLCTYVGTRMSLDALQTIQHLNSSQITWLYVTYSFSTMMSVPAQGQERRQAGIKFKIAESELVFVDVAFTGTRPRVLSRR